MIKSCYVMNVLCDNPDCEQYMYFQGEAEASSSTFQGCKREFVLSGWYMGGKIQLCPECKSQGIAKVKKIIAIKGKRKI